MPYFATTGHSWLIVIAWILIYLAVIVALIVSSKRLRSASADLSVLFFTVIVSGVLPGLVGIVINRQGVAFNATPVELEVIYHLSFTFASALAVTLWGCTLTYYGLERGKLSPALRAFVILLTLYGVAVILTAIAVPQWFLGYEAYVKGDILPGVYPSMINSPISIFRILLVFASFGIPVLRVNMLPEDTSNATATHSAGG